MKGSEFRLYQDLGSRFPILALEVWARSFASGLNCFFGLFGAVVFGPTDKASGEGEFGLLGWGIGMVGEFSKVS